MIDISTLRYRHQSGAALPIALIMLLLMTLIGVSAIQVTSLEEKMASNNRQTSLAFEAAEAMILEAEDYVATMTRPQWDAYIGQGAANGGLIPYDDAGEIDFFATDSWTDGTARTIDGAISDLIPSDTEGRYFIKRIGQQGDIPFEPINLNAPQIFRITARGKGTGGQSTVILQTHYLKIIP